MKTISSNNLNWEKRFTYKKVIIADEKTFNNKGSKFQIVSFEPHTRIPPHYHKKTVELYYIRHGSGRIILNGKEFVINRDDMYLIEPTDSHEIINDTDGFLTILIFKSNEEENDIYWVGKDVQI